MNFERSSGHRDNSSTLPQETSVGSFTQSSGTNKIKPHCELCMKPNHHASDCRSIKTAAEKVKLVRLHKLCFTCLSSNHLGRDCRAPNCSKCHGPHHASICRCPANLRPAKKTSSDKKNALPSETFVLSSLYTQHKKDYFEQKEKTSRTVNRSMRRTTTPQKPNNDVCYGSQKEVNKLETVRMRMN